MNLKKLLFALTLLLGVATLVRAQVTISPASPTLDTEITIVYDATQGTSNLQGADKVYMHSSVGLEPSATSWEGSYTVGNWGQDDGIGQMTSLGDDKWEIKVTPRAYYNIPQGVTVYNLSMVFRNADGSAEGKSTSGGDIFVAINPGTTVYFTNPAQEVITPELNTTVNVTAESPEAADLMVLAENGVEFGRIENATTISGSFTATATERAMVTVTLTKGAETVADTFYYFSVNPTIADVPAGIEEGINYITEDSVVMNLYAPGKGSAFLLGDWNDWQADPNWLLNKSSDGDYFWIGVGNLTAGQEYNFQYLVDGGIRISDPYAEKVVYSYDQSQISNNIYPNALLSYPNGKTTGPVGVLQPGRASYPWQVTNFDAPDPESLVIYELLIRDFAEGGSYQAVIDSLPYLISTGVNAIEFMPVKEFPGQDSWGYNPAHFTALEKAYGTPEKFKELVDLCHQNGIAVILDVVFNHTQEDNPLAKLYWDEQNFRPAANSPWLNQAPTHPFNVFFDFNHESEATKRYVDKVCKYWLSEYQIDGFRFDLSKGFTQTNNPDDVGAWSARDDSRIKIIKDISDKIWAEYPDAYITLEHLGSNEEEKILAAHTNPAGDNSIMLWGNMHGNFKENILGFRNNNSNVDWTNYQNRDWSRAGVIGYMESHDEERQMYEAVLYGNDEGNVKTESVALQRIGTAATLLYGIPGPKMFWQFGEYGYDYSINYCFGDGSIDNSCRTGRKPIVWDYLDDPNRYRLYRTQSEMIKMRTNYRIFQTSNFEVKGADGDNNDLAKYIRYTGENYTDSPSSDDEMNAVLLVNLDINDRSIAPNFHHTGTWYNYVTGEEMEVTDVNMSVALKAGEFAVFTDFKVSDGIEDLMITTPNAPTDLAVTEISGPGYALSWVDNADNEDSYVVERRKGSGNFTQIATLPADATSYTDTEGLEEGSNYAYRVAAKGDGVLSEYAVGATGTVLSNINESLKAAFVLFPNPSEDQLQFKLQNEVYGSVMLIISDLTGKEVQSLELQKTGFTLEKQLNINDLRSGAYLLKVATSNGYASKLFFKK